MGLPPPWLLNAAKYIGFHETGNNQGIEPFIALAHTGSLGDPWCAIFANACLEEAGFPGTRSPAARSFENHPNFIRLDDRAYGAITTMWRGSPSSGQGHVYFYMGENENGNIALGGNEDDQVEQEYLPQSRVTGYWWPKSFPLPAIASLHVDPAIALDKPPFGELPDGGAPWQTAKGSWFSQYSGKYQWVDTGDAPGSNALGVPDSLQGIAFPSRATLGKWFEVGAPNGNILTLRQTDIGPGARTGRGIDIAAAAAERFGYTPLNFPTDGIFRWRPAFSQPAPAPQPTHPEPPPMPDPIPNLPSTTILTPADIDAISSALAKKSQPMLTAVITGLVGILPQLGIWGLVAQQVLVALGTMGPAIGSTATPTVQSVAATLMGMIVSGLLSKFNKGSTNASKN